MNLPIVLISGVPMEFTYDGYKNPSAWLYLSDGTYIEVEHEERLPEPERYFYIRRHCSSTDFRMGIYDSSAGVIAQSTTNTFEEATRYTSDLVKSLSKMGITPVKLHKVAAEKLA